MTPADDIPVRSPAQWHAMHVRSRQLEQEARSRDPESAEEVILRQHREYANEARRRNG